MIKEKRYFFWKELGVRNKQSSRGEPRWRLPAWTTVGLVIPALTHHTKYEAGITWQCMAKHGKTRQERQERKGAT